MHTLSKDAKDANTTTLEKKLAEALVGLKPFRLNKSWIRVPKEDSEIGVGGFGIVHRAVLQKWPLAPKVHVAVKKLHTKGEWEELVHTALALVQELDVWAKLDHPNILPLLGFHLSSRLDEAWLVSPYASNGNIFEYLERTQLGLDSRLELAKDTAKGLEYLHTRTPPICHGDIKSLNVLIDTSGHAMLCDLGLAKATDASVVSTKSKSTNDGGTIRYCSPELFDDGSQPTLKSDIWAWGSGNIKYYRSEWSLPTASNVSSIHLDSMEKELADILTPLEKYRINPGWFEIPKVASTIGSGGFGVVHRAIMRPNWRRRGVDVAVKKLRSMGGRDKCLRMVTALIREVAVWATLSHPNIIPFIGFYLSPRLQEAWLVAPLMIHGNLSQYILSVDPDRDGRLNLALDTANGLQYLHNHKPPICHGDIKPLNVLINAERRAVLCDFGLAKSMESMPSGLTTSTFNQAGSLAYESPELLLGTSLRSLESDVWAWGCLLQEVSAVDPLPNIAVKQVFNDFAWIGRNETTHPVFQELEGKLEISVWVGDVALERPRLSFGDASRLGSGSFGAVYGGQMSTEPPAPPDMVAIRQLFPPIGGTKASDEDVRHFISRLRLQHINVLPIIGYCTDPSPTDELLLLFPYVPRGNLDTYLRNNTLDDSRKTALATEIAEGLLYLHTRSSPIAHGHLHPRNILMNDMGHPLLCDCGFGEFASYFRTTPPTLESLCYQSPEAVVGVSQGTVRGDVWSWGSVLLRITSGHAPYDDVDKVDALRQHFEEKIIPVPLDDLECYPVHMNLLGMCWRWDPLSRPTMGEINAILTGKSFLFVKAWSTEVEEFDALRFSRDSEVLAVESSDSIAIHKTRTGNLVHTLALPDMSSEVRGIQFSSSGRLLARLSRTNVIVWDLATQRVYKDTAFNRSDLMAIDVSADDTFCAIGCRNGTVYIWDINTQGKYKSTSLVDDVQAVEISPGCKVVAAGTQHTGIHLLNTWTLETLAILECKSVWAVRFSPDGDLLFGGGAHEYIARCWDITSIKEGKPRQGKQIPSSSFRGHKKDISSVAGNPTWFMSISDGGEVHAVNLATGTAGGKTSQIGSVPQTAVVRHLDLSPVSDEGTGYIAIGNFREVVI
ncbi:hypothetical protein FRB99_006973, partial [Tulasnella sp. 403]